MSDFNPGAIRAKLEKVKRDASVGANRGLKLGAEHLLGEAQAIVPTEEGVLENTGKVSTDEGSHTAAVSFDTPYAVRQHEELTWKHDPGRHAKYLETPMNTEAGVITALVGSEVRKEIGL